MSLQLLGQGFEEGFDMQHNCASYKGGIVGKICQITYGLAEDLLFFFFLAIDIITLREGKQPISLALKKIQHI